MPTSPGVADILQVVSCSSGYRDDLSTMEISILLVHEHSVLIQNDSSSSTGGYPAMKRAKCVSRSVEKVITAVKDMVSDPN